MTFYEQLVALENKGVSFVLVTLVDAVGSTPQDAAAKMLVTAEGIRCGTVGGGKVEAAALSLAAEILAKGDARPRFVNWTLKGDVGMTCGGSVKFYFEPHPASGPWNIAVFGAGHVAQALIPVLVPLPCRITCVDARPEWLERIASAPNLQVVHAESPESVVPSLPDGAFLAVMTMGHATDRPILRRALAERNFPFIGVIGSDSKAEVLRRELAADGVSPDLVSRIHCPIGLDFGTNHPHEIAISIAAQLLTERDRVLAQA
ncbi:MAG TPA: xanthine dehydrogenase accessory protein XdhC [Opitutaceae bacterium]|nr:xanthine dehydrogenase accessory protein XdhC [Opitutaceae bacterium]